MPLIHGLVFASQESRQQNIAMYRSAVLFDPRVGFSVAMIQQQPQGRVCKDSAMGKETL